jgi:23S rRNA (adenine2030-N6)-methyltransferase
MNGSGLLVLNAPWQFDTQIASTMRAMRTALQEPAGGDARVEWLRAPA